MKLSASQWDLLRIIVDNHQLKNLAEFYVVQNVDGWWINYSRGPGSRVLYPDLDELRRQRLIRLQRSGKCYRGWPTQLGISAAHGSVLAAGESARPTVLGDSIFWRSRREEFERLTPGEYSLLWSTRPPMSLGGTPLASHWSWWHCPDESLKARLSAIALKCAKALGRDSEDGWFDELRNTDFAGFKLSGSGRQRQTDGTIVDFEGGALKDVVKHSITMCHVLEAASQHHVRSSGTDGRGDRSGESPSIINNLSDAGGRGNLVTSLQVKKYADQIFRADLEDRIDGYEKSQRQALHEASLRHNAGAYVPALIACKKDRLQAEILTLADAWVKAGQKYNVPLGDWAYKALEKEATLISGGIQSALSGQPDLHAGRTRTPRSTTNGNQEIKRTLNVALRKAKLKLDTQRIEAERSLAAAPPSNVPPAPNLPKNYKTGLGRNVDRLRKECGWSFDDLANATELDKKLILGHVNGGKGAHPKTLESYAQSFSEKLGRTVTVAEVEG